MSVAVMVQLRVKHNGERHLDALRSSALVRTFYRMYGREELA